MEAGRPIRSDAVISRREDSGSDQAGGDEGKDSRCVLKAEPTGFAAEWRSRWEGEESVTAVGLGREAVGRGGWGEARVVGARRVRLTDIQEES